MANLKKTVTTTWYPGVGDRVPGRQVTIRGDGAYDGHYELVKAVSLIECGGRRSEYRTFQSFWQALSPTAEELALELAEPAGEFLHLLSCGLRTGRPITRHRMWDDYQEVAEYRDYQMTGGILAFFVYEVMNSGERLPKERSIARIDFNIADGKHARHHVADFTAF